MHSIGTATGEDTEGRLAEVESSVRKRNASDQVSPSVDREHKEPFSEDHFSRNEAVQAIVERIDSPIAKNKNLELRAADGDAKARETGDNLIKECFSRA